MLFHALLHPGIFVVCPTNAIPSERHRPHLQDKVYFERRFCPQINDFGVVMLIERLWAGWVQRHHVSSLQYLLDLEREINISGRIMLVEDFFWAAGGGDCSKGIIELLIERQ